MNEELEKQIARLEANRNRMQKMFGVYLYRHWLRGLHFRADSAVDRLVRETLLVSRWIRLSHHLPERFRTAQSLPNLPDEMWEHIMSFFPLTLHSTYFPARHMP